MKHRRRYLLIEMLLILIAFEYSFADVRRAMNHAQAGLDEALKTEFPSERKYVRLEKRDDGILVYKVSMRRIDEQTIRFRITGYDGVDEVSIVTYRIIHDNIYKTIEEYRQLKRQLSKK